MKQHKESSATTVSTFTERCIAGIFTATIMLAPVYPALAQTPDELYQSGILSEGRGDVVSAMGQFRRAADMGHAASQYRLGWLLDGAEMDKQAVSWYRKSAEQGFADSQFQLGVMISNGEGIEQDKNEARRWIEEAASQNHSSAMDLLSRAYEEGLLGLEPDDAMAKEWLERGLAAEHPWAVQRMSRALRNGELGFETNAMRADELDEQLKSLIAKP